MGFAGVREWTFALKTFAAGLLALYVSMWAGLSRPYWALATVYVASQVVAGATRSKAAYRVAGTLIGAAASVAIVPNFVNSPELLTLAIALWVAGCLYLSMLNRSASAYVPMLAGYTVALIGFPAVGEPDAIFDVAVSRAQEITIGVVCAAVVSSTVLPQSAARLVAARIEGWIALARGWVLDALRRAPTALDGQAARLRLAADAIALDALAAPLRYELSETRLSRRALLVLRQHMLMFLPIVVSISDRARALDAAGELGAVAPVMDDMSRWLASGSTDEAQAEALRAKLRALDPSLEERTDWVRLMLAGLIARLSEFIDLRQDVRKLQRHIAEGAPLREPFAFLYTARARAVRHQDHGMTALSALSAFISILIACAVWIALAWPDGSAAPMFAAVTSCLFATQDDPAPRILGFATASIVGVVGAGVCQFALLPQATGFEMVALAIAPGLILCGLMIAQPRYAAFGLGAGVTGATSLAIQDAYSADFASFANSSVALIAGAYIAATVTRLVRSVGAGFAADRLRRINRRSLVLAASGRGGESGLELAALMLDRLGLIAPRLASLPNEDAEWTAGLLTEVRIGVNIVELRRARRQLPEPARMKVNDVLADVARYFRDEPSESPAALLSKIDAGLEILARDPRGGPVHSALLGLAGLRLALFPHAAPYGRPEADAGRDGCAEPAGEPAP